jgi:septal ring factor EnvC (AmiA/AmiB activator)
MFRTATLGVCLTLLLPGGARAQDGQRDLRDSRMRLDSIRQERVRLQQEMQQLQARVRDASREVSNVARQRAVSSAALQELELQVSILTEQVDGTRAALDSTRGRLDTRTDALHHRLRSIHKRGPLHSVRVLLTAENFSQLMNRYKYLQLITARDRDVIREVASLERQLYEQDAQLEQTLALIDDLRREKTAELQQLRRVESQTLRTLDSYRQAESTAAARLDEAERNENRLNDVITRLERDRVEEERRRTAAGTAPVESSISNRDVASLEWPIEGNVIYRFGPVQKPSGVTLINKGIGIAAAAGMPVRVVEAGTVTLARTFEGYGPTVMVDHGGGFYTLYMYLRTLMVKEGDRLDERQVVGTVGGEQTPEGPHLLFQMRAPIQGTVPEAVDPLIWLKRRPGG